MPASKPAWENIENYQAFVKYQTQEAAAAAGAPGAKTYIATEDEKEWCDRNADKPGIGKRLFAVKGVPWVMYVFGTFTGKQLDADQNGIVEDLAMPVSEALKVNIKPKGPGMTNVPGTGNVVPVPLSGPLGPTQKIRREFPMGDFKIRNYDVLLPSEQQQQSLDTTLATLVVKVDAVAAKADKILAKLGI